MPHYSIDIISKSSIVKESDGMLYQITATVFSVDAHCLSDWAINEAGESRDKQHEWHDAVKELLGWFEVNGTITHNISEFFTGILIEPID